jgi:hypothetical protein
MRREAVAVLLGFVLLTAAACEKKETPRLEVKSQAKNTGPDGAKATTTTESVQVGSTLSATTETRSDTSQGKTKTETEEVIGTVTAYRAGKEIVVLTGDNKKHSFDLDQKDTRVDIEPRVTIGTKVQLVQTKDDAGRKSIVVSVQPNR